MRYCYCCDLSNLLSVIWTMSRRQSKSILQGQQEGDLRVKEKRKVVRIIDSSLISRMYGMCTCEHIKNQLWFFNLIFNPIPDVHKECNDISDNRNGSQNQKRNEVLRIGLESHSKGKEKKIYSKCRYVYTNSM